MARLKLYQGEKKKKSFSKKATKIVSPNNSEILGGSLDRNKFRGSYSYYKAKKGIFKCGSLKPHDQAVDG